MTPYFGLYSVPNIDQYRR